MNRVKELKDRKAVKQLIIKALILGSGNIGTDLALRMRNDQRFEVVGLVGRRPESEGLLKAEERGIPIFSEGASQALAGEIAFNVVFDATSATNHIEHWNLISDRKCLVIDLTPSQLGRPMVPILIGRHDKFALTGQELTQKNFSMITCGGQSAAALIYAMQKGSNRILEVEISSSIASRSAGLATRRNIDNYIMATESLASSISGTRKSKAILVLNPTDPPVMMRTTVTVNAIGMKVDVANQMLSEMEEAMQDFVPGYRIVVPIFSENENIYSATAIVEGAGFYLPKFAGNLDVINAAAVETAGRLFESHFGAFLE